MVDMNQDEKLWLVFCVGGNRYAIDSACVGGVVIMPDDVTPVPEAEAYVRGIVKIREQINSILDMRVLFGNTSVEQEIDEFQREMAKGRADHEAWVDALRRCIAEGTEFHGAIDGHHCSFGRWYDNYTCMVPAVRNKLALLDDPHQKIHQIAGAVRSLIPQPESEARNTKLAKALQQVEEYKQQIFNYMSEAERSFRDSFRMMLVMLHSEGNRSISLMVDEIVGVEKLSEIHDDTLEKMDHSELVDSVALDGSSSNLLFLLNQERIFELGQRLEEKHDL